MSRAACRRLAFVPAVAVVLAGCAPAGSGSSSPVATATVDLPPSYRFAPTVITVAAGTTVTWTNSDNFTHNVTISGLPGAPSVDLPRGASGQLTLSVPGTHPYVCTFHPKDMRGEVVVTGS